MKYFTLIFFLCITTMVHSQSEHQLSEKYRDKLSQIKNEKKRLRKYRRFLKKDSLERHKTTAKAKKQMLSVVEDSLLQKTPAAGQWQSVAKDTSGLAGVSEKAFQAVRDSLGGYGDGAAVTPDSTITDQARSKAENYAREKLQKETGVDVPEVQLDSTLTGRAVDHARELSGAALEDELGTDLPHIKLDSTATRQALDHVKGVSKAGLEDELGTELPDVQLDSTLTRQVGDRAKEVSRTALSDELGTDIPDIRLDSAGRANLVQEAERRAEEALKNTEGLEGFGDKGELTTLEEYKNQFEQTQQEMRQALAKQELKEKMASQAKEYISKHADKIQQVQSKMGELKKKYSYVPNSNDLSTAKKRSSLEDEPLGKRLVFGGNFNVTQTNPVNIDIAPLIGYRINKLFEAGITGLYRAQFEGNTSGVNSDGESTYGYGAFVNHMVFRNFFGHLEGENISRRQADQDRTKRVWDQTLLLGIGRRFTITKWLEMQAIISYNFLHDNQNGVYNSPVVFKTGVRVKK